MTTAKYLKSAGISSFLISLLWIRIIFIIILTPNILFVTLLTLIKINIPSVYASLIGFSWSLIELISSVSSIIFAIWIYRIHVDLKNLFPDYPITPGGALVRIMIPFYNIIWVFSSMTSTFTDFFTFTRKELKKLTKWVFYSFLLSLILIIILRSFREEIESILLVIGNLGWTVVILELTKTMQNAVTQKAKQEFE